MIYLDNAASTPVYVEVIKAIQRSLLEDIANPSAAHALGTLNYEKIKRVKNLILETLNAPADYEVLFTSSATEANNQVIGSIEQGAPVYYSSADHPSLTRPIEALVPRDSRRVISLDNDGTPLLCDLSQIKCPHILFSHINSFTGVISPVFDWKKQYPEAKVHVDASQSFSKFNIDLKANPVDSLSLSAHKIGGPVGVAALVFKKDLGLKPLIYGGGQEEGLRSSTLSTPLILGWEAAIQKASKAQNRQFEKISSLKSHMTKILKNKIPDLQVLFSTAITSPYITLLALPKVPGDVMMRFLEQDGIYVSRSSACSSKIKKVNPVLSALSIPLELHKNILRIFFSYKTSAYEVDMFCEKLVEYYLRLNDLNR